MIFGDCVAGINKMTSCRAFRTKPAGALVLSCIAFGAASFPLPVKANPNLDLLHLQVFAKQSIHGARSDFQGPTAAGSGIELSDFEIGGDLTSAGPISFSRGSVKGLVSSPDRKLSQLFSSGAGTFDQLAFDLASMNLDLLSARLSNLQATQVAQVTVAETVDQKITNIIVDAARDLDIIDLSADQLISNETDHRNLMLKGDGHSRVLIRVSGRRVQIRNLGFVVAGDLTPSQVLFYFPEATDLEVDSSGGATSPNGESWGIPGSLVAPNAVLRFSSALITGQVFVKEIAPAGGPVSGQVNRMPSAAPERPGVASANEFTPSEVLRIVSGSTFVPRLPTESGRGLPRFTTGVGSSRESRRCLPHLCTTCEQSDKAD